MHRLAVASFVFSLLACASSTPSTPTPVWVKEGASDADRKAALAACADTAQQEVQMRADRREAELRATLFLRCMQERGWHQEIPTPAD